MKNYISPLNGQDGKLKARALIVVMEFLPANRNEFKDILNLITRKGNMFYETYVQHNWKFMMNDFRQCESQNVCSILARTSPYWMPSLQNMYTLGKDRLLEHCLTSIKYTPLGGLRSVAFEFSNGSISPTLDCYKEAPTKEFILPDPSDLGGLQFQLRWYGGSLQEESANPTDFVLSSIYLEDR